MARCRHCKSFDLYRLYHQEDYKDYKHHASYVDLIDSALDGCDLCQFIWARDMNNLYLRLFGPSLPQERYERVMDWKSCGDLSHDVIRIDENGLATVQMPVWIDEEQMCYAVDSIKENTQIYVRTRKHVGRSNENEIEVLAFVQNPELLSWDPKYRGRKDGYLYIECDVSLDQAENHAQKLIQRRRVREDPRHEASIFTAKSWVQRCVSEHEYCKVQNHALPTRVIDVGEHGDDPYLFEARGRTAPYVALSHCWGDQSSPPLMTTTSTLQARLTSIAWASLPRSFRDAIFVTRRLGYQYLWIDSLCILQDSALDWSTESARMGDLYRHAIVTLKADCAPGSHDGFLKPRQSGEPWMSASYHIRLNDFIEVGDLFLDGFVVGEKDASYVDHRAWCLQEYLLATRTISYTTRGLVWSCMAGTTTEDLPSTVGGYTTILVELANAKTQFLTISRHEKQITRSTNDSLALVDYFGCYTHLVNVYMARSISFAIDRLPAWSAVAQELFTRSGWAYQAGLWEEHFFPGLLWTKVGHGKPATTPYVAPSWSWAAVEGGPSSLGSTVGFALYHFYTGDNHLQHIDTTFPSCEFLNISIDKDNDDPFGKINGGHLIARGRLKCATTYSRMPCPLYMVGGQLGIKYADWAEYSNAGILETDQINAGFDSWKDVELIWKNYTPSRFPSRFGSLSPFPHAVMDAAEPIEGYTRDWSNVFYLQITRTCTPAQRKRGDIGTVWALVLEKVSCEQPLYGRIGLALVPNVLAEGWAEGVVKII